MVCGRLLLQIGGGGGDGDGRGVLEGRENGVRAHGEDVGEGTVFDVYMLWGSGITASLGRSQGRFSVGN